ncbi:MAG: malonyl-CoA synthase [Fimbriimonadaceae bacterium]|nr:malonyl-CoA synthase [Alphaproteobacteria bacterium]
MNLFEIFRAARPDPDGVFLKVPDGRVIRYGDIDDITGRIANILILDGVEPGDRVMVQVDKSPEALMVYLACLRAGAAFLPLNIAYTPGELDYFLRDAAPRVLICAPENLNALRPLAQQAGVDHVETLGADGGGSLMEKAAAAPGGFSCVPREDDDLAAILYTSGTTGRSKGAMLSHKNLASNARVLVDYWHFTGDDVLLHALPVFHAHGLFTATNTILLCGGSMLFLPKFDAEQVIKYLPQATVMMGVPTFYTRLLAHDAFTAELTRHMRLFISGSAPLLAETHEAFRARTGHAILERYGMSETNMNTSNPYDGDRIAGTVGFPLPGISLRIADAESGAEIPRGEIGVIELKGPNVFQGYWRNPGKTASEFRGDGYFITGDLARIDERGYVHIVGRAKDLIISGGYNVYPKEVESEIDDLDGVAESAVFGIPHPEFGEGVTAAVVLQPGSTLKEPDILAALSGRLARFKQPKHIVFVDELPRNTMGKVQKNLLRDEYSGQFG